MTQNGAIIGERLRQSRRSRGLTLQEVADQANVSVATISRIENSKQGVDLDLFVELSKILDCSAGDLIDPLQADEDTSESLSGQIGLMSHEDRTRLWRKLAAYASRAANARGSKVRKINLQVEELLAQVEFLQAEIRAVNKSLRRRPS